MSDTPPAPRPKSAQMFMAMPLLFGAVLMGSVLVLAGLVWVGGTPDGARITVTVTGQCIPDAQPLIVQRMDAMGLGDPVLARTGDALQIDLTLPGRDPQREQTTVPQVISQRGWLEVRNADTVLMDRESVKDASLQLDENGSAMAVLEISEASASTLDAHVRAHPTDMLDIVLDGDVVATRPNTKRIDGSSLRIIGDDPSPRARMALAADQVIVLQNGPMPCELVVDSVVESSAAE